VRDPLAAIRLLYHTLNTHPHSDALAPTGYLPRNHTVPATRAACQVLHCPDALRAAGVVTSLRIVSARRSSRRRAIQVRPGCSVRSSSTIIASYACRSRKIKESARDFRKNTWKRPCFNVGLSRSCSYFGLSIAPKRLHHQSRHRPREQPCLSCLCVTHNSLCYKDFYDGRRMIWEKFLVVAM